MEPRPLDQSEIATLAAEDRQKMFAFSPMPSRPIDINDAMARALKYNLDRRVKLMEEALAFDQTQLDRFDLLPKAVSNAGFLARSDNGAASATDSVTGQPSLANPFYSQDRRRFVHDLSLSWNILDLGVSWVNAHQNADRVLIARERRRKATLSILSDVRSAYWRAVGAQALSDRVRKTIAEGEATLKDAEKTTSEQLRSPLDTLRFQKTILENVRQLRILEQEVAAARAELAALMNMPPAAPFRLSAAGSVEKSLKVPTWNVPIGQLEELAFLHNPEALDNAYQARIAVDDTRKAILKMLPGLTLDYTPKYDSNSFLVANAWQEASVRLGTNLVTSVLAAPTQIAYSEGNEKVVDARRLAVRMAILAQVHVATEQIRSTKELFKNANQLYQIDRKIADTVAVREANEAQSKADKVANKTVALTAEMRVFTTYAQLQASLGRLQSTVGVHVASDDEISDLSLEELSGRIRDRLEAIDAGHIHETSATFLSFDP